MQLSILLLTASWAYPILALVDCSDSTLRELLRSVVCADARDIIPACLKENYGSRQSFRRCLGAQGCHFTRKAEDDSIYTSLCGNKDESSQAHLEPRQKQPPPVTVVVVETQIDPTTDEPTTTEIAPSTSTKAAANTAKTTSDSPRTTSSSSAARSTQPSSTSTSITAASSSSKSSSSSSSTTSSSSTKSSSSSSTRSSTSSSSQSTSSFSSSSSSTTSQTSTDSSSTTMTSTSTTDPASATASPSPSPTPAPSGGLTTGGIAATAIIGTFAVAMVAFLIHLAFKRRRQLKELDRQSKQDQELLVHGGKLGGGAGGAADVMTETRSDYAPTRSPDEPLLEPHALSPGPYPPAYINNQHELQALDYHGGQSRYQESFQPPNSPYFSDYPSGFNPGNSFNQSGLDVYDQGNNSSSASLNPPYGGYRSHTPASSNSNLHQTQPTYQAYRNPSPPTNYGPYHNSPLPKPSIETLNIPASLRSGTPTPTANHNPSLFNNVPGSNGGYTIPPAVRRGSYVRMPPGQSHGPMSPPLGSDGGYASHGRRDLTGGSPPHSPWTSSTQQPINDSHPQIAELRGYR
ncbi:MAG: hypothetical protein M1829_000156 [Trizodia sp. TS-e1964]|nr:MAG: hypothetical protein M1829_000156 [Trizodia sp. TS-e1964]